MGILFSSSNLAHKSASPNDTAHKSTPQPGYRHVFASFGGGLTTLGLGFLLAAFVVMLGRVGSAPFADDSAIQGGYFTGTLFGVLAICALSALAHLVVRRASFLPLGLSHSGQSSSDSSSTSTGNSHLLPAIIIALGLASGIAGAVCVPVDKTAGIDVAFAAGLAFGAGIFAMGLAWIQILASLDYVDALRRGAGSLVVATCTFIVAMVLKTAHVPLNPAAISLCLSAVCCYAMLFIVDAKSASIPPMASEMTLADQSVPGSLDSNGRAHQSVIAEIWAPVVGVSLYAFLLGTFWAQIVPGQHEAGSSLTNVDWAGPLAAAMIMWILARRVDSPASGRRLLWVLTAIASALLLMPTLTGTSTTLETMIEANLHNAAAVMLVACLVPLMLMAARASGTSPTLAFSGCFACPCVAGLIGFFWRQIDSVAPGTAFTCLFIVFFCALVTYLVLAEPIYGGESREALSKTFDAYLQPRCAKLTQEHGLTNRESEILGYLARGHSYAFIANNLYVSEATVRSHAHNIYVKLSVQTQEELIGLIDAM